jgi:hypothetical protein
VARAVDANPDRVVVTTQPFLPRIAWNQLDQARWLLVDPGAPGDQDVVARLSSAGVHSFVFVSPDFAHDRVLLAGVPARLVASAGIWDVFEVTVDT